MASLATWLHGFLWASKSNQGKENDPILFLWGEVDCSMFIPMVHLKQEEGLGHLTPKM